MSSHRYSRRLKRSLLLLFMTLPIVAPYTAAAQGSAPGQVVEDGTGNIFMEEVIDQEQWNREEAQRKKKSNLERRPLTNEELSNVGMQVTPSGKLIPLINRGAPPVREMGTRFTTSFEPLYPAYVVGPGMPPYGYPYYGNPYGMPGYGYPGFGVPFNNPFINPFVGGYPAFGYGQPWWARMLNPIATPYIVPPYPSPYNYFGNTLIVPPSYSYTWQSSTGSPQTPTPSTFSTSGSVLSRPFWSGYAGSMGSGGILGLPSVTQYDSTTTFTPILPSFSTDNN